jgi:hypothetical protein
LIKKKFGNCCKRTPPKKQQPTVEIAETKVWIMCLDTLQMIQHIKLLNHAHLPTQISTLCILAIQFNSNFFSCSALEISKMNKIQDSRFKMNKSELNCSPYSSTLLNSFNKFSPVLLRSLFAIFLFKKFFLDCTLITDHSHIT